MSSGSIMTWYRWLTRDPLKVGCAILVLCIPGWMFVTTLIDRAHRSPKRASCVNSLKQIGIGLQQYRKEHNGAWPQSFPELYPEYVTDLSIFICESSDDKESAADAIATWSSYEYLPPNEDGDLATTVVCWDKKSVHIPSGKNELFADGRVSYKRDAEVAAP